VVKGLRRLGLAQEAGAHVLQFIRADFAGQQQALDGDAGVAAGIQRGMHNGHGAAPEFFLQLQVVGHFAGHRAVLLRRCRLRRKRLGTQRLRGGQAASQGGRSIKLRFGRAGAEQLLEAV
jgi:hypothetical protein